jgi:fermentation-respiration switch protein FrsA (DUF1100 family)
VRRDAEFASEGTTLRGWLYLPDDARARARHAGVVVTAGFASVKETFGHHDYPAVFCWAGFAVLVYDHANCGTSDGLPRQELDPVRQQRGYRDAITFLASQPEVDPDRIGIWGTSYSGGHVLGVAAVDRRVRAVVSQAMTISGHANTIRRHTPDGLASLRGRFAQERLDRMAGKPPAMVPAFAEDSESVRFNRSLPEECRRNWRNEITLLSWEMYDEYEPAALIERISPTPLLMIVATGDTMTPAEDALAAYHRAHEPKALVLIPGGHYAGYTGGFETTSAAARDWFARHLA